MELSSWVEAYGSLYIANNVRGALEKIDTNEEFIKLNLAILMSMERIMTDRNSPEDYVWK